MGRSLAFNLFCNLLFVCSGYIMHFFLGSVMTPAEYGVIGTIITILDFEYLFLNYGTRQSIAKEISKQQYHIRDLVMKSVLLQLLLITVIFSINYFGASLFSTILQDPSLNVYLRYAAFLVPANGLYVLVLGINEGFLRFVPSALIGIVYSIFKLSVIPFILFVFSNPIIGTEFSFFFALISATLLGVLILWKNRQDFQVNHQDKIPIKQFIKDTAGFSLFFMIVSIVMSVDTLVVKSLETDPNMAGYYTGAVNFAKVSYFLLMAFSTILLPTITKYYSEDNMEKVKSTITTMLQLVVSFILPITCVISASSGTLLASFYRPEYIAAALPLSLLSFSHLFMGITVMFNMILAAINKKQFSTRLAILLLLSNLPLSILLTNTIGMLGAASVSILSSGIAMELSVLYTRKFVPEFLNVRISKTILCNLVLWGIVFILFQFIGHLNIIVLGLVYVGIYVLLVGFYFLTGLLTVDMVKNLKN